MGVTVDLEYRDLSEKLIKYETYTSANFEADSEAFAARYTLIPPISAATTAANDVIADLTDDGVIAYYDLDGDPIAYGTRQDDIITKLSVRQIPAAAFTDFVAVGGPGNDTLIGGVGDDSLVGGQDNDTLTGNGGDDYLDGGSGTDIVLYDDYRQQIIGLATGGHAPTDPGLAPEDNAPFFTVTRGDESDVLHSIEKIVLSNKAETLKLASGTDLSGVQEIDFGGQDGGTLDILDFTDFGAAITFADGKLSGQQTVFTNLEAVIGSTFDDTLKGRSTHDKFKGGAGQDTLKGDAGDDYLDGGVNIDTALYDDDQDAELELTSGGTAPTWVGA
jgi:Ca2+-binding RTX toxin-like protein